ncbi:MAG: choice-of-anchor P family protein [Methylococcales bacterium]
MGLPLSFRHRIGAVVGVLLFAAVSFGANAETASGLAYGGDITVNLLGGPAEIDTGPLPSGPPGPNGVAGSGVDSFGPINGSVLFVPVNLNVPLLATVGVDLGVLTGEVSYMNPLQFPPVPNSVTSATGAVTNVDVSVNVATLLGLGVTADAVESTSEITGVCGALTPAGTTTLTNAGVTVGANPLLALDVSPAPNTGIDINVLGLAGVTLILNEQVVGGNGITTSSISTNALHLTVSINLLGLVFADIILGHSEASVNCNTADLSIIKMDSPDPVVVGSPLTYTVQVTNNGPGLANEVTLQDTLPAGVTVNSITPSGAGSCTPIGVNPINCVWPSIPAGGVETVTVVVTPNVIGMIINTAVTRTDDFDNDPSDNTAMTTTTVIAPPATTTTTTLPPTTTTTTTLPPGATTTTTLPPGATTTTTLPTEIPAINNWGLMGIACVMAFLAMIKLRRRQ